MLNKNRKIRFPSFAPRRTYRSNLIKLNLFVLTYLALTLSLTALYLSTPITKTEIQGQTLGETTSIPDINLGYFEILPTTELGIVTPTDLPPTSAPEPTPTPTIAEDTTKIITNVENDSTMADSNQIVEALNNYRKEHGAPVLQVETGLSNLAQERANKFATGGTLDGHAGFRDYMNNNGFETSGFNGLGENSAMLSGPMQADKIIKEIFGQSEAHNTSQLDSSWTHVGVAINGIFVNVNFGKNKK